VCGVNVPVGGGGYLRLFPYAVTRWSIQHVNKTEGRPAIVYIHPWELDPAQPWVPGRLMNRFRQYVNLHTTETKLHRLLGAFSFGSLQSLLRRLEEEAKP
jgi:hypothetical protein